jgi:succinoglycan biosynthesis protein ExoW
LRSARKPAESGAAEQVPSLDAAAVRLEAIPTPSRGPDPDAAPTRFGVVVPFYQRQPGFLRRALESVCAQTHAGPIDVVIVDDGSPLPVAAELDGLRMPARVSVRCTPQRNAGPGAARNAALNGTDERHDAIAFLDSDDWWEPEHLSRAAVALAAGADFYFANYRVEGESQSAFERHGLDVALLGPALDADAGVHWLGGDLAAEVLRWPVFQTSAVVFRRAPFATRRFDLRLRSCGEDQLFFLQLLRGASRVATCTTVSSCYGRGLGVYQNVAFGSAESRRRLVDSLKFLAVVRREFRGHDGLERAVRERQRVVVDAVVRQLLHDARRLQPAFLPALWEAFRFDPSWATRVPAVAAALLAGRRRP